MTIEEFDAALAVLGWKVSDFCRATGLHRNTPSRWHFTFLTMKKPVLRTLDALLRVPFLDAAQVPAALHVMDMGSDEHSMTLQFQSKQGHVFTAHGVLSGVRFRDVETRGAPKKQARDVALALACHFFECGGENTKAQAREAVLDLWSRNGWQGLSETTHLNKKLRGIEKTLKGLFVLTAHFGEITKSKVIALPRDAFDLKPHQHARGNGVGWVWCYVDEVAKFGKFSFDTPLFG